MTSEPAAVRKHPKTERSPSSIDASAMHAVRAGDRDALAGIYDRHASAVYGLALRVLRRPHDAESVVSDVFFELWRRPEKFDADRASLRAYLLTVTRSRAIDRARASATRATKTEAARDAAEPLWLERQVSSSPEKAASLSERQHLVREAVERLDAGQRKALVLAYFHGMTHREIAACLSEPLGTVKTRLRSGLSALRAALSNEVGGL